MKMLSSSRSILLNLLCLLPPLCLGWEDWYKYTHYPNDTLALLNETVQTLGKQAPQVDVLITLPGKDFFQHMQEVAVRNSYNNGLFHLNVNYLMEDGLNIHCRKPNNGADTNSEDRLTDHHPNNHKDMCKTHCTHAGRYCPVFSKEELKEQTNHNGYDLVMEVLRRLCLGQVLPHGFASPWFYHYLAKMHTEDCMANGHNLTRCSLRILDQNMPHLDTTPDSPFAKCVMAADADTDTPNPLLEKSLDFSHQLKKYTVDDLPVMEIGGKKFTASARADRIQKTWCDHFDGPLKPVSCDFCQECNNAKSCLWFLNCDNVHFDLETYKDPKHKHDLDALETVEEDVEIVVEDTGKILGIGIAIGLGIAAVLWLLVEFKRHRAVAEVAHELPDEGFRDTKEVDVDEHDVELPEVS